VVDALTLAERRAHMAACKRWLEAQQPSVDRDLECIAMHKAGCSDDEFAQKLKDDDAKYERELPAIKAAEDAYKASYAAVRAARETASVDAALVTRLRAVVAQQRTRERRARRETVGAAHTSRGSPPRPGDGPEPPPLAAPPRRGAG